MIREKQPPAGYCGQCKEPTNRLLSFGGAYSCSEACDLLLDSDLSENPLDLDSEYLSDDDDDW